MKHLLIILTSLIIPLSAIAHDDDGDNPGNPDLQFAEMALELLDYSIESIEQSFFNFDEAIDLAREADANLENQIEFEDNKSQRRLLQKARIGTFKAELDLRIFNKNGAINHLEDSMELTLQYLNGRGGKKTGLCCTRPNCRGCTLVRATKKFCKDAGIYKTWRKHIPSNPYPNKPLKGQCVKI